MLCVEWRGKYRLKKIKRRELLPSHKVLFHRTREKEEEENKNIFRVFILDYTTPELNMKFDTFSFFQSIFNALETWHEV